jgi:hypothetical protein
LTVTAVVVWALTLNVAEPLHCSVPSTDVAVRVTVYPLPTGMPPMTAEIIVLCDTSIAPVFVYPCGPVMV